MPRWAFKLTAVLGSIVFSFLLLETALRVHDLVVGNSQNARTYWYWMYEQDPYLGYRGRPRTSRWTPTERIVHDADGFRDDRDLADLLRAENRRLIICVGESSTYGLSASSNATAYPAVLENELRRLSGDQRWVVFNAGMPGYTSHEILGLIHLRLLKFRPAAILSMNLRNDLEFYARSLGDRQDYDFYPLRLAPLSRTWENELLMRSSLYGFLAGRTRDWWVDDLGGRVPHESSEAATERGIARFQDNVAMTALLCRRAGVRLMYVDQPVDISHYSPARVQSLGRMREALAVSCKSDGLDLLAADARFDWKGLSPQDDVHPGTLGYERLAKLLAPQVLAAIAPDAAGGPSPAQ